jgi:hypothetical protein
MNKKITLNDKVKTLQDFTQFIKDMHCIEGTSLIFDFLDIVKNNIKQIKEIHEIYAIPNNYDWGILEIDEETNQTEKIEPYTNEIIKDLELLQEYFENIIEELEKESKEQWERDCIDFGNEFWKDLYSDGSAGDM